VLRSNVLAAAMLSCCLLSSIAQGADPVDDASRSAARKLGYSGVEAYQAGDYATASEKLERAYRVLQVPSVGLWSARALAKLGKLVEASERYQETSRLNVAAGDERVQKKALADAASELEALTPKIPSVRVRIEGASAAEVKVAVDGAAISPDLVGEPRPVNPGQHRVEGSRGSERAEVNVVLSESEHQVALLKFALGVPAPAAQPVPEGPPAPSSKLGTQRTLALVAGGIGLVGIGVGTVFGFKSMSSHDEAAEYCDGSACRDPRGVSAGEDAHTFGNVSTVGMLVGALGLGGGVVLWLTAPKPGVEKTSARLTAGPGTLALRGAF
jgi:hypothetical protein